MTKTNSRTHGTGQGSEVEDETKNLTMECKSYENVWLGLFSKTYQRL
jgi:hypothetical protein